MRRFLELLEQVLATAVGLLLGVCIGMIILSLIS